MRSTGRHRQSHRSGNVRARVLAAAGLALAAAGALATTLLGGSSSPRGGARADVAAVVDRPSGALRRASRGHRRILRAVHAKGPRARSRRQAVRARPDRVVAHGVCEASYYDSGDTTADGAPYDPDALTAAHRTLPMGARVRVTNPGNGRSVVVRINDRGPFVPGRCLDLSTAAMRVLKSTVAGVVRVRYEVLASP